MGRGQWRNAANLVGCPRRRRGLKRDKSEAFEAQKCWSAARSSIDFVSAMLALHKGMYRRTGSSILLAIVTIDSTVPFGALLTKVAGMD
jgi:hypothetical protein